MGGLDRSPQSGLFSLVVVIEKTDFLRDMRCGDGRRRWTRCFKGIATI